MHCPAVRSAVTKMTTAEPYAFGRTPAISTQHYPGAQMATSSRMVPPRTCGYSNGQPLKRWRPKTHTPSTGRSFLPSLLAASNVRISQHVIISSVRTIRTDVSANGAKCESVTYCATGVRDRSTTQPRLSRTTALTRDQTEKPLSSI